MSGDLLGELFAGASLNQPEIDWLLRHGVPPMALVRPLALGTDAVVFQGARFEFARYSSRGEPGKALILPGIDERGELVDLIAWRPASPALASWFGRAALLGAEQVAAARFGQGLHVHESPLEWLSAERQGVVIVDPRMGAALLRDAEPLSVAGAAHGARLRRMLHRPAPRISIVRAQDQRAA